MNVFRLLALLASISCLAACAAPEEPAAAPAPPAVDLAAEAAAVRARSAEWLTLAQAKDAAGVANLFLDDGVSLFDGRIAIGKSAVQASQESNFAANPAGTITWTTASVDVAASGDLAVERGSSVADTDGEGAAPETVGEYVTVWKKVDGTWRVFADAGTDYPSESTD